MSNFLEIALQLIARGFHVLPLKPRDKAPIVSGGCHAASTDEEQVRVWWTKTPQANVGIGCGASNKAVLDIDHGLNSLEDFHTWRMRNGLPETYTVRTGRRPEFGIQMYFDGAMPDVGAWELDGCSGQVKSLGGLVVAAGSIHPDSGETYQVICDVPFAPTPDVVRQLQKPAAAPSNNSKVPKTAWSLPVHEGENRTGFLLEQTGAMRNLGCGKDAILARMIELNEDLAIIADPVNEDRLDSTAANCAKFPVPEPVPEVFFGGSQPKPVTDWREHYHSVNEHDHVGLPEFLIDGFLQRQAIMGIGAFVGQKKTLFALNVSWSLCSGEPLFGKFNGLCAGI